MMMDLDLDDDEEGGGSPSRRYAHSSSFPGISSVSEAALFYPVYDDFQTDARKQAAADALTHFSQFAMLCATTGVPPSRLKLELMKQVSGMPSSLDGDRLSSTKPQNDQTVASSSSAAAAAAAPPPASVDDTQLAQSDDRMET